MENGSQLFLFFLIAVFFLLNFTGLAGVEEKRRRRAPLNEEGGRRRRHDGGGARRDAAAAAGGWRRRRGGGEDDAGREGRQLEHGRAVAVAGAESLRRRRRLRAQDNRGVVNLINFKAIPF